MPGKSTVPNRLLNEAAQERSFRKQVLSAIGQLLRDPDTDPVLRVVLAFGCLVIVGISFVLSVFLIHAACAFLLDVEIKPFNYAIIITIKLIFLMGLSIPLVVRGGSHERALRLESSFNKISSARVGH